MPTNQCGANGDTHTVCLMGEANKRKSILIFVKCSISEIGFQATLTHTVHIVQNPKPMLHMSVDVVSPPPPPPPPAPPNVHVGAMYASTNHHVVWLNNIPNMYTIQPHLLLESNTMWGQGSDREMVGGGEMGAFKL